MTANDETDEQRVGRIKEWVSAETSLNDETYIFRRRTGSRGYASKVYRLSKADVAWLVGQVEGACQAADNAQDQHR